jgi:hypothetical protein
MSLTGDRLPLPVPGADPAAPVRGFRGVRDAGPDDAIRGWGRVGPAVHFAASVAAQQAAEASARRHNGLAAAPLAGSYTRGAAAAPGPPPPVQPPALGLTADPLCEDDASVAADMLRSTWEVTPLALALFSGANLRIVQNALRRRVYEASNGRHVIGPQDADQLRICLRAMYLQYGRNAPTDIPGQIAELNERVVAYAAPLVISQIAQSFAYEKDITTLPVPIAWPVSMSQAGTRSMPLPRWP